VVASTYLVKLSLDLDTVLEELLAALVEGAVEDGEELDGLGGEDLLSALGDGEGDLDASGERHCG